VNVLLLTPSIGLGGGIERYVSTLEGAFHRRGIPLTRLAVTTPDEGPTLRRKLALVRGARAQLKAASSPTQVLVAHPSLLPVVALLRRLPSYAGCTVIVHGSEAWGREIPLWKVIARQSDVRVVGVSNFTAGVLVRTCRALVLTPGLSEDWFRTLATARQVASETIEIVSVFRLESWRDKGLATLLEAVRRLDDPRVHVTICGSGRVSPELQAVMDGEPRCELVIGAADADLASRLASAYVVVLASRTGTGAQATGEGFGMTLLEAQVAGTPIIAPAFGGSGDAFQPGVTGVSPTDQSAGALAAQLARLIADRDLRDRMARSAADWARTRFEPQHYAERVVEVLLGECLMTTPGR
jgi:phosphatidyl-myo-inositol dimannoside synthase